MKVGVTLPSFRDDAEALAGAQRAEALGLDGVFVFDHLWPLGQPERPALSAFVLLGAVAAVTRRVHLGPLVARIGLASDALLVAELRSLDTMAPGRVVAALGTGDAASRAENDAYGVGYPPAEVRRRSLEAVARAVADTGTTVWIGGGAPATAAVARRVGAALNLWDATAATVRARATEGEVTWGGPVAGGTEQIADRLVELAGAGATWAVCAWPASLEAVADAAAAVR